MVQLTSREEATINSGSVEIPGVDFPFLKERTTKKHQEYE
jgi:hypothetical protein